MLFDLDGTIVDSARDLVESVLFALRRADGREPPDADTILMEVGKPLEVILRELGYPHGEPEARCFAVSYRKHFSEHHADSSRLYPGMEQTLELLAEAGARLAVVTTKQQEQAEMVVAQLGIADRFGYVRGWQEGRRHKPDPEPFLDACAALGVAPASALVVGDTEQDVIAAKTGGMASVAVTWGFRPVAMLHALRPDFIVSRPTDIVPIVVDLPLARQ